MGRVEARLVRIYRVIGRREGRLAMRLRVAASGMDEAKRIAEEWSWSGPASRDVTFNLVDVHGTSDYVVVGEASENEPLQ